MVPSPSADHQAERVQAKIESNPDLREDMDTESLLSALRELFAETYRIKAVLMSRTTAETRGSMQDRIDEASLLM
jgi:hypothetical protein